MLPMTTSVSIRGDLEQRVTASGRLGASSVVTPPAAAPAAISNTDGHACHQRGYCRDSPLPLRISRADCGR
jgi:hypothetical protein